MKDYFKRFRFLFIVLGCLIIAAAVLTCVKGIKGSYVRANTECLTEERVFDYGDLLTDDEEASLRGLIAEREAQTGCDIVLVTLNESVGDSMYALMDYADDFYDENRFGYDKPWGDGVILVDNWYSYGNYNGDTWLSTSGRVEERYSTRMINDLLDDVCDIVNVDPYKAYTRYVNDIYKDMSRGRYGGLQLPGAVILIIALIVTIGYLLTNISADKAKRTTTAQTYVVNGKSVIRNRQDVFVTKHTTSRRIESSSGGHSGGGGHHTSSGGHSHGGGGRHH